MLLYLDIETLPCIEPALLSDFRAKAEEEKSAIKAPSNYKDEAKIAEFISAKAAEIDAGIADKIKRTSFDGLYGRVCVICAAIDDGPVEAFASSNELQLLMEFYQFVDEQTKIESYGNRDIHTDAVIVGHNVHAFDLPFLKHRSIINGIKPPANLRKAMNAKTWDSCIADTMLMWSQDREKRASMDKLCKVLGIPGKGDFNGSMVAETWPTDPQKVIDYCKDDVERTRQIYKRLTFQLEAA